MKENAIIKPQFAIKPPAEVYAGGDVKSVADAFCERFTFAGDALSAAAGILRQGIKDFGRDELFDQICRKDQRITHSMLNEVAMIGIRFTPELMGCGAKPGPSRLKRLPLSTQRQFVSAPVPVLTFNNGNWETIPINVFDLTKDQALQVFDVSDGSVRSEAAQRAWIESNKTKSAKCQPSTEPDYSIKGAFVTFKAGTKMHIRELAAIVSRMA